jgi:hypothetical protein
MCYHLNGMDYVGDPYKIYCAKTSSELREFSKLVLNTAFNAASRGAAIASCNDAKRFKGNSPCLGASRMFFSLCSFSFRPAMPCQGDHSEI